MTKTTKPDAPTPEQPAAAAAAASASTSASANTIRVRANWTVKYGGKWRDAGAKFPVAAADAETLLAIGAVELVKASDDKGAA